MAQATILPADDVNAGVHPVMADVLSGWREDNLTSVPSVLEQAPEGSEYANPDVAVGIVWAVVTPEGPLGVYVTEKLADLHASRFPGAQVEWAPVLRVLDPAVFAPTELHRPDDVTAQLEGIEG